MFSSSRESGFFQNNMTDSISCVEDALFGSIEVCAGMLLPPVTAIFDV